jgi:hypothetical protein
LVALAVLVATQAVADEPSVSPEARKLFKTGVALLRERTGPKYEEAYRAFKAAYRVSPSPKILGNLGLCAMMLERDGEAIAAYRRYLDEVGDIADDERKEIERELALLEASAVALSLDVSPVGEAVVIDERRPVKGLPVINRYELNGERLSLRIRAGLHHLRVERDGYVTHSLDVVAEPGQLLQERVTLEPEPEPTPTPEPPGSVWEEPAVIAGLTITGTLAVAMGVTMGIAFSTHDAYEDARAADDGARGDELRDRGQALNIASDVLLGAAAASALVTLGLVLFLPTGEEVQVRMDGTQLSARVQF